MQSTRLTAKFMLLLGMLVLAVAGMIIGFWQRRTKSVAIKTDIVVARECEGLRSFGLLIREIQAGDTNKALAIANARLEGHIKYLHALLMHLPLSEETYRRPIHILTEIEKHAPHYRFGTDSDDSAVIVMEALIQAIRKCEEVVGPGGVRASP